MPALAPIQSPETGDWPDVAVALIRKELRGRIDVIVPGTRGTYNGETDAFEGGTADQVVLYDRRARVRPLSNREIFGASDPRTVGTHRITIEMQDGDPLIPDEAVLVIRDGGKNKALTGTRQRVLWAEASTESPFLFITSKAGD